MIGDRHSRFEEASQHLSPTVVRFARLIASSRVAEQKNRRNIRWRDLKRADFRARVVEFQRELLVPIPDFRRLLAVLQFHLAAASDLWRANVNGERARFKPPALCL